MSNEPNERRLLASNKRARHDYHILETHEAGLSLWGTEVKSARAGKVQLKDSYVEFRGGEAFLVGAHISEYSHGNRENHLPERERKLLMHRKEIDKLSSRVVIKGFTVVPLQVYLKHDRIKVEVALVQGKRLHDKRETEKRREQDREAREAMKTARHRE